MYDLFSGDQLVIVGRYRKHGGIQIRLTGNHLGKEQVYSFDDELPKQTGSGKNVFVERLWATRRIGQIIDEIDLHGENRELVDELITLSKRHGILTPYTAYLAEEQTDLNNVQLGRQVTREQLRRLEEEVGEMAFEQRSMKSSFRFADRAAAPASGLNMPSDTSGLGGAPQDAGLRLSMGRGMRGAGVAGKSQLTEDGVESWTEPVKRIGAKTFYLRDGRYIDSQATDKQIADAITIEQFSDAYFDLLEKVDESTGLYFAEDREVLVILSRKAYRITLAKVKE